MPHDPPMKPPGHNKFKAEPTIVNGHRFASKAEARRYMDLLQLAAAGEIFDLELQPRFLLQEGFECRMKKHRAIEYVADFKYRDQYKTVVEDVKGMKTDVYLMKVKMLIYKYRDQFSFCEYHGGKRTFY